MTPVPISAALLAPFATLLTVDPARRTAFPVVTAPGDCPGRPVPSTSRAQPLALPAIVTRVERHPHTSQTFLPLSASRWLVTLLPSRPDGSPDASAARCFIAGASDAVCFHRNVWHAPLAVLDRDADMAMLMWRPNAGDDTETFDLPEPLRLGL